MRVPETEPHPVCVGDHTHQGRSPRLATRSVALMVPSWCHSLFTFKGYVLPTLRASQVRNKWCCVTHHRPQHLLVPCPTPMSL